MTDRLGRADLHIHTLASDGLDRDRRDPRPRRARDRPRRHRDHRPRADRRGGRRPDDGPRARPSGRRSSSARRSRPSAATCSRCSSRSGSGRSAACGRRSARSTSRAGSRSRPIRSSRTRCAPRAGSCGGCIADRDPRVRPDAIEAFNPTMLGRPWHGRVVRFAAEHGARRPSATATPTRRRRSGRAGRRSRAARPTTCAPAILDRRDPPPRLVPRDGRPGLDVRPAAPEVLAATRGPSSGRKVRRDGTGRDLGYPGGRHRPPRFDEEWRRRARRDAGADGGESRR